MILGILLIVLGLASFWQGCRSFRDWRANRGSFQQYEGDETGFWNRAERAAWRFNDVFDLWILVVLGPLMVAVGLYLIFR